MKTETGKGVLQQIVTFRVGSDLFAADIFSVERVLRYMDPREIPNVPLWIEGVIDYQSRVVPVIDLRKRFEIENVTSTGAMRMVVFTIEGDLIAGIVDEVLDVQQLSSTQISKPPQIFRGLSADFIRGIARRDEKMVVILDFARVFSTNERLALEKIREDEGRSRTAGDAVA